MITSGHVLYFLGYPQRLLPDPAPQGPAKQAHSFHEETPSGSRTIFSRFRSFPHQGEVDTSMARLPVVEVLLGTIDNFVVVAALRDEPG